MSAIDTMRSASRGARHRAGAMGHSLKDRVLEKRLDRAADEAERLRFENDLLRDEVAETRSEHGRILDLLESRLDRVPEVEADRNGHRGRWLLFLGAIGAGAFAWFRMRSSGAGEEDWSSKSPGMNDLPAMTRSGTGSI